MTYVTSDLHGYPLEDFRSLLLKAGFSNEDELYVLGDVIDRNGDGGIQTLLWMMRQENVHFLLGNHEMMLLMCGFLFKEVTDENIDAVAEEELQALSNWIANGARCTIDSLTALCHRDEALFNDLMDYLSDAQLYELLKINGKAYLLVHSGLGGYSAEKDLPDYSEYELLWTRPEITDRYYPGVTVVFGHTPTVLYGPEYRGRMLKTDSWIDIDTGAAARGGKPMLLRLEDQKPFYADDE